MYPWRGFLGVIYSTLDESIDLSARPVVVRSTCVVKGAQAVQYF